MQLAMPSTHGTITAHIYSNHSIQKVVCDGRYIQSDTSFYTQRLVTVMRIIAHTVHCTYCIYDTRAVAESIATKNECGQHSGRAV